MVDYGIVIVVFFINTWNYGGLFTCCDIKTWTDNWWLNVVSNLYGFDKFLCKTTISSVFTRRKHNQSTVGWFFGVGFICVQQDFVLELGVFNCCVENW